MLADFLNDPQADDLLARVLDCVVPVILDDMLSGRFDITQISRKRLDRYVSESMSHHKGHELSFGNVYAKIWCLALEEWKKVNADHHNGQGAPDSLGTFTECIVNNGEAMNLEASTTINAPYIGETSMQTVEKRWDGKDPGWIEAHIEPTHRIRLANFEGLKPRLSRMIESLVAGFMAYISTVTRQLVGQSEVKLLRRDGTGPNTIPCGERKWRMTGTDVVHLLKAIDKETLKSTVVAESDLPPDVRDLEENMRPTIIAWRNSFKDKRGVYGGVPENVPAGEPQTAYNLLRWLCHCGGTKNGLLRKLYWAIFAADDTLVAKGRGMQEFLDMFGTKNRGRFRVLRLANVLYSIPLLQQTHLQWAHHF